MSPEYPSDPMAVTLGRALKHARRQRGLTTRQVAALAGVSQSFLSNVENGRTLPSVPSLYALAASLGIAAAELLPESFAPLEVTRSGAGTPVPLDDDFGAPDARGSMFRVGGSANHRLDVYELELMPGYRQAAPLAHPGEDFLYVVDGRLDIALDATTHSLATGDSLWWESDRPHSFQTPIQNAHPVRALIVSRSLPSDPPALVPGSITAARRPASPARPTARASAAELAEPELAADVGRAIRRERRLRKLTVRELARRVEVSQPFLSNVENGRSLPSVPLLYSIAMAFDLPPSRIMPQQARDAQVTHSQGATVALDHETTGSVSSPLSFADDRLLEAHHLVLQPGYRQREQLAHRGEDFVYVLGGELMLDVGDESARLRPGDSARFDAQLAHGMSVAAAASTTVRALLITAND